MRLRFDIFDDEFKMVKEELITNKKTGEELSLAIIDYSDEDSWTVVCVIEIKRKRIVPKAADKNAK